MEYGHEIVYSDGTREFFVEDCSYCHMITGGLHESHCPCYRLAKVTRWEGYYDEEMDIKKEVI